MRIVMTRARRVNGEHVESGSLVEVVEQDGRFLCARGMAEEVDESRAKALADAKTSAARGGKGKE